MNGAVQLILGILIGAVVLGVGIFLYWAIRTAERMAEQIKRLTAVLAPFLEGDELQRGFKAFRSLAEMANVVGEKMDSLNNTFRLFSQIALNKAETPAAPPPGPEGSAVYGYNEGLSAAREAVQQLRSTGIVVTEEQVKEAQAAAAQETEPPPIF